MVKHTQIIRRQQPTDGLNVFDHFVGLAFKGLIVLTDVSWVYALLDVERTNLGLSSVKGLRKKYPDFLYVSIKKKGLWEHVNPFQVNFPFL